MLFLSFSRFFIPFIHTWENVFPISWDIFVGIMSAISESGGSGKFGGGGSSGRGGFGGGSSRGGGAGRSF